MKSSLMQSFNSFSAKTAYLSQTIGQRYVRGGLVYSDGKFVAKRMCCTCKKSQCLKLYCECFASLSYCSGCNCTNCLNTPENQTMRDRAIQATKDRNANAFDPKIVRSLEPVY